MKNGVEAGALTKWVGEPTLAVLKADLEISKPSHTTHIGKVRRWLDLRNAEGTAKPKTIANRSSVQPKLVRRQAEWRYSALSEPLLSSPKMYKGSPATFEDGNAAKQNELILEWQFRTKLNRVQFIDEYVRTAVDEGTVAVRVGWKRETIMVDKEVPVFEFLELTTEEEGQQLQMAVAMKKENPNGFLDLPEELQEAAAYAEETGTPVIARITGTTTIKEEKILKNQPTLDIINYENLYLDPSCEGKLEKAGFGIISFETSKAELIKDGRYKNLDNVLWNGSSPIMEPDHSSTSDDAQQFNDDLRKRVVAYEYWGWHDIHKNNTLVPIVATWIGGTMIRMEENPYPDKSIPIVLVSYLPVKRSVNGEPDAELLGENQAILGAVTRGSLDLMGRSANGQTGFAKGLLDVVNRRRYNTGQDYEFNPNMPPSTGIYAHKYPEIPQSALTMLQMQNQEAEALTGVKAFSGGLSGAAFGDVAAGIRGMLDAAGKREMAILRRMAKGMEDIGNKITSMNAVFLSEKETVRVTNTEFVVVRREDLEGEFDLIVDIATAEIDEAKSQDLSFMLQTMGNTMDPAMTRMLLSEIATLKRMPELAHKISNFVPQPDPAAEEFKKLELQKAQMEIAELQSKIDLNIAKARQIASDADLKDLTFLEDESGTTHLRDMDKMKAQADGNKELAITNAILAPDEKGTKSSDVVDAVHYNLQNEEFRSTQ